MKFRVQNGDRNGHMSIAPAAGAQNHIREHMDNANSVTTAQPSDHYNENHGAIEKEYDIALVGGERGRRLAAIQVESILEVAEWFSRHPSRPTTTT